MSETFTISHVMPVLPVYDIDAAAAFYERLGFTEAWRHGEPTTELGMSRDGCTLMLSRHDADLPVPHQSFYVFVANVDAMHGHCRSTLSGVEPAVLGEIGDREYEMRDFKVCDPWGHRLTFGESLERVRIRDEGARP